MSGRRWLTCITAAAAIALGAVALGAGKTEPVPSAADPPSQWSTFNGDLMARKYTADDQITAKNVGRLKKAWEVHTGDVSDGSRKTPATDWSATPLFANDTVYVGTPFYRIFAVAPDSGKVKWVFDTHATLKALTQPDLKSRGVAYWQSAQPAPGNACQKVVYLGTMEGKLYAVDADNGRPCTGFGNNGVLDINQWNKVTPRWPLSILQPPTVYGDTLFIGWAGKDWSAEAGPPGQVFAVDARTGALKWTFHALPPQVAGSTGTANVWASMSVDPGRGILYLPVSSPSPNFYGGDRKEPLPYGTSVTALDAATGKVLWSRQLVHHDLWDFDVNAAPVLVDLTLGGQSVPALIQSTKQGMFFVLNRLTGEPIYPIEERRVPASDVPGEQASATQPFTSTPAPVMGQFPGISALADIVSLGGCSRHLKNLRYNGMFTPPALGAGALAYPATPGGVEWGGGALDPRTQTYVVNSSSVAQIYRLLTREEFRHENGNAKSHYYGQIGAPYGFFLDNFNNWLGMPCWKPPYGFISSYDLASGRLLWRRPFGVVQKWGFYMPRSWGSPTIGGPMITRGDLVFIGASMDSRVRALDVATGNELWSARVDAPAVATPASYTYRGKQYVLFVAGGNSILSPRVGDQLVAFALR